MNTFNMIKNTIKFSCLASLLVAGAASANNCEGFAIKLKNNLPMNLIVKSFKIQGAKIEPQGINMIGQRSEATFTINNVSGDAPLPGEFELVTLNGKTFKVQFNITNSTAHCEYSQISKDGDLVGEYSRVVGGVEYPIN